uniref:Amidohydrolase-related domain-containing protein n=1 Tax=Anopheles coluzzii TaxID=1518534 RepID=A0A8W7PPG2_ANOCL
LGILPHTISSDIYCRNRISGPVFSLAAVMSKFFTVGLSLAQVIDCVTANAAAALRLTTKGRLQPGLDADLTIFELRTAPQVINTSGRMTILGVSTPRQEVIDAVDYGLNHYFEIKDLVNKTGAYIAELLNVEDAVIVSCASAGIAQSVAAVIVKDDANLLVNLHSAAIEACITPQTAAIMYVKSHHCVQKSILSVEQAAVVARKHNLPLIVDAAAEEDLMCYYQMGADLVIYSGAKAIEGPTSGLVIGKKQYVAWVKQQSNGIGRAMKVGKEGILGLTQAIESYLRLEKTSGAQMVERMTPFITHLNTLNGVSAKTVWDSAGRDIARAEITFDEAV